MNEDILGRPGGDPTPDDTEATTRDPTSSGGEPTVPNPVSESLGYRRLPKTPRTSDASMVIMQNELQGVIRSQWALYTMVGILVVALSYVGLQVYAQEQTAPGTGHTMTSYVALMNFLRWGALVMAAVLAGPSLLEDANRGALELYLARPIRHRSYLVAKALPTLLVVILAMWIPALVYYSMSFFIFESNPPGWHWTPLQSLGYSVLWAIPVTGAGFAVSCLARSGMVASIWLVGSVVFLDILVADILAFITDLAGFQALSPSALHAQQSGWIYDIPEPHGFSYWWGLVGLAAIAVAGWSTMAIRYPRLRGGET